MSCFLLFIFIVKLTAATGNVFKTQKTGILISNDNEDGSGGNEKKNEGKPAFNSNEFLNPSPTSVIGQVIYYTICSLHPELLINFISTHYPAVLTPPPNC
ncbi:MAG: hypothetical protein ACRYFA_13040 [Janthinobacterium lividum]